MIANEGLNWWASTCRERWVSNSQGSKIFINSSSNLTPVAIYEQQSIQQSSCHFPTEYCNSEGHYDNNEGLNWWASICRENLVRRKLPCVFNRRMSMSKKERNLLTFAQVLINFSPCFIPADHRVAMAERANSLSALAFTQIQECIGSPKFLDIKSKLRVPALWFQ